MMDLLYLYYIFYYNSSEKKSINISSVQNIFIDILMMLDLIRYFSFVTELNSLRMLLNFKESILLVTYTVLFFLFPNRSIYKNVLLLEKQRKSEIQ